MRPRDVRSRELRFALFQEGSDALVEVRRAREDGLCLRLQLELLFEGRRLGRVEQPLRLPDGARRHRGKELGDLGSAGG